MQNTLRPRHVFELVAAQLIYWLFVGIAIFTARDVPAGAPRAVVTLLPVLPGLAIIVVAVRIYRRCDEFIRMKLLEAGSIVAALTAAWTLVYTYLEIVGLPKLSMVWVGNVGWGVFIVFCVRLMLAGRHGK